MSEGQRICPVCGEEKGDEEIKILARAQMWVHASCVTPNPPISLAKAVLLLPEDGTMKINLDGTIEGATAMRHCRDSIHVFEDVPGYCQCGSQHWESVEITT